MLRKPAGLCALLTMVLTGMAGAARPAPQTTPREAVFAAERAFAKTMRDRDHAAFQQFLSREAVFFSQKGVLRGPVQVA